MIKIISKTKKSAPGGALFLLLEIRDLNGICNIVRTYVTAKPDLLAVFFANGTSMYFNRENIFTS